MLGFANGRGLAPPVDDRAPGPVGGRRRRLYAVKETLDGIGGLGWSVVGFVGGAVFWHFIGFWGFVSEVVLAGGPPPVAAQSAIHAVPPETWPHGVQVAAASMPACTLLSLDRRTGITSARPCDRDHAPLPADSLQGRQDRLVPSGRP